MCKASVRGHQFDSARKYNKSLLRTLALAAGLLLVLPTSCYLNRGFTVWFHWLSVLCWLSDALGGDVDFLRRSLVLLGTSVCAGWYCCVVTDYVWSGRPFMRLLHQNMPDSVTQYIFYPENAGEMLYNKTALMAMAASHALDFLGHPFVTYVHWYQYCKNKNQPQLQSGRGTAVVQQQHQTDSTIFTWPVIAFVYGLSRIWSFVHNYYNFQTIDPFYTGFEVYVVDDASQWIPAYVAETVCIASVALYNLLSSSRSSGKTTSKPAKPSLVYSESSMSERSFRTEQSFLLDEKDE